MIKEERPKGDLEFIANFDMKYGNDKWGDKRSRILEKSSGWGKISERWKNFLVLESHWANFYDLYTNYFDDLNLFALMYRNVDLSSFRHFIYDAYSVIFFSLYKNTIIGYGEYLKNEDSARSKATLILLDCDIKCWATYSCFIGFNISPCKFNERERFRLFDCVEGSNALKQSKDNKYPFIHSVCNLTDWECKKIINCQNSFFKKHKIIRKNEEYHIDNYLNTWKNSLEKEDKRKLELERIENEKRIEKYSFNKRNAHVRDKNIELRQSDHIYIVNDIAVDSVTTFVNNAFPKFDAEYHAKRKAEQLGVSIKEVLDMWEQKGKESRDLGTAMHSKIENYYLGNDSSETDAYKLFKIFASKIELKPYRTEWAVYDWEHKIAGTIDFVDFQNGEYIIYDWKRSEKVIENGMPVKINKYGEKGNYPLEHLDNTPYYHYALQLSLYKYILEKNYGMKISDLRLGIFHPTYNKPYVLRMPYLEKEINDIFNLRSDVIF